MKRVLKFPLTKFLLDVLRRRELVMYLGWGLYLSALVFVLRG